MTGFECGVDKGGQAPQWVICTHKGGFSFLVGIKKDPILKMDIVIWCTNLKKAKRFSDIGTIAQYLAIIPPHFMAYEEDDRFMEPHNY